MKKKRNVSKWMAIFLILISVIVLVSLIYFYKKDFPTQENDKIPIKLMIGSNPEPSFAYFWVAKDLGFYNDEDLNVSILPGKGSSELIKLAALEQIDFGTVFADVALTSKSKGIPVTSVMVLYQNSPSCIMSLKEKNITGFQDLYGKKIGTRIASGAYKEYTYLMKLLNISKDKIIEVPVENTVSALLNNQVDAIVTLKFDKAKTDSLGKEINLICFEDNGINTYGVTIIANDKLVDSNPDIVRKFVKATLKGMDYTIQYPDKAAEIFQKNFPENNINSVLNNIKLTIPYMLSNDTEEHGLGYQTLSKWESAKQMLVSAKTIDENISVKIVYTNEFLR